jgi:hypothetical protein
LLSATKCAEALLIGFLSGPWLRAGTRVKGLYILPYEPETIGA